MASIEHRPTAKAAPWRVVWRQDGQKQREMFATRGHAEDFVRKLDANDGRWPYGWQPGIGFAEKPSGAPTFRDWAARSIASRSTANDRTRHDYLRDIRLHLNPAFGEAPLDQVTAEMVGAWIIDARHRGLSEKTIKNVHSLASSLYADAIAHQLVSHNPFKGRLKTAVAVKQEDMTFMTRDEFETLLGFIEPGYRTLVLCLAHTGMRWSEATALRVGDVDLLARRIQIVRAWKRTPENWYEIGEPKTRRSRRTLIVSTRLALALADLCEGRHAGEYVFTSAQGRPVRHSNFRLRTWTNAVTQLEKQTGKRPRIHDCRHSHASWLIADKVNLPAIQRRLGHESITTTIDRYGHLMPDVDDEISAALDRWQPTPLADEPHVPHTSAHE